MPLSWNEIRNRALHFSKEWKDAHYEKGETQSFYDGFFDVFGISRRKVGFYEQSIKKLDNKQGFIDLFWPGTLLVEQKSAGRSLKDAKTQAMEYLQAIKDREFPRYILLSDFQNFDLLDLETGEQVFFPLKTLHENIQHFAFIAGYKTQVYRDQDPVNIEASELMSELHQQLEISGYKGHDLEMLLVRLMFCLFADDTGIFEKDHFLFYLQNHTKEDGSDLGGHLLTLFDVLNTSEDQRQKTLDEDLVRFPYVNGALFEKPLRPVSFDSVMRDALMQCCLFDWSRVSPALFGSLFQTVMLPIEQRKKGAHYTSEKNILKVIKPLFLDDLWKEFEKIKTNNQKLKAFHEKLNEIRIFDPACGCGNFLILAYRELRVLELELLKKVYAGKAMLDVSLFSKIDVDQFYGIELEEFPARIAETAMWLIDHQMNMELSEAFGQAFVRLPLKKSARIVHGNALTMDWKDVLEPVRCSHLRAPLKIG
ncbi:MAG: class I SAM-dependent DNA methyltransferase [Nitrospina sp.]|nr:class I SAM-dependent DNA methyltransferase [Nitrospina sp.]